MTESLLTLMSQKEVKDITVTELCKSADINRTTFYKYYDDIFDMLDKVIKEWTEAILPTWDKYESHQDVLFTVLQYVYEHKELCSVLFTGKTFDTLLYMFQDAYYTQMAKKFQGNNTIASPEELEYLCVFLINGPTSIVLRWIKGGYKESPDYITKLIIRLVDKVYSAITSRK
jgi:AcrR family transcriptional regulator